jgi:uncharacterized membrane-anchored protein YhcB (DUF1043 family)
MSNDSNSSSDIQLMAGIVLVVAFAGYIWLEKQGWDNIINKGINFLFIFLGIACFIGVLVYYFKSSQLSLNQIIFNKKIAITFVIIGIIFMIVPVFEINYYYLSWEKISSNIAQNYQRNLTFVGIIPAIINAYLIISGILRNIRQTKEGFVDRLNSYKNKIYCDIPQINKSQEKLEKLTQTYPRLTRRFNTLIEEIFLRIDNQENIIYLEAKEQEEREKKEEKQRKRKDKKIERLLNYFLKKDSCTSIPLWAVKVDHELISRAKKEYHAIKEREYRLEREEERIQEMKDKASQFILKNEALPSYFHKLSSKEQEIYLQKFKDFKAGKIVQEPNIELHPEDNELLESSFYEVNELTPEQKERFVNQYGYKHYPFFHLNGKLGNNLIIRNPSKTESDYHFCMKHLFARLDEDSEIEYPLDGMRADVVFFFGKKQVAIEIETGMNNEKQVKEKVKWLNKNFDYWIIVCPKKKRKLYSHLVDKKKSFCLTSKNAEEKINTLKQPLG